MTILLSKKNLSGLVAFAAVASIALGCSSTMGNDSAGNQMNSGMAETRSGLTKTQTGVNAVSAGSRPTGMMDISDGMGLMGQGVTDMRQGMSMMSGNMMMNCANGGSDSILTPMQQAMDEMRQGQGMMGADAGATDDEGVAHMQNGMSMMTTALDHAQTSMNCMGHNGTMSGGMM